MTDTMDSFQQLCPACEAVLELPLSAQGRSSFCPACNASFTASTLQQHIATPVQQVRNLLSEHHRDQTLPNIRIEMITSLAFALLRRHYGYLLAWFLIPAVVMMALIVMPILEANQTLIDDPKADISWLYFYSPVIALTLCFVAWQACLRARKVTDHAAGEPKTDPSDAPSQSSNGLIATSLATLCLLVAQAIAISVPVVASQMTAQSSAVGSTVSIGLSSLIGLLLSIGSLTVLWPLLPLCEATGFRQQNLMISLQISTANPLTSFLIGCWIAGCIALGFGLFGIGLVVTLPFAALLCTVALRCYCGIESLGMQTVR